MKSNSLSLWALWLTVALTVPSAIAQQKVWDMTTEQQDIHLAKICSILEKHGDKNLPDGMCEYSTDNWINWLPIVWYTGWTLITLIWAGALIRIRREKKDKNSSPEALSAALKEMQEQARKLNNKEPDTEWSGTPEKNEPKKWFVANIKRNLLKIIPKKNEAKKDNNEEETETQNSTVTDPSINEAKNSVSLWNYSKAEAIISNMIASIPDDEVLKNNPKYFLAYMYMIEIIYMQRNPKWYFQNWVREINEIFPNCIKPSDRDKIEEWKNKLGIMEISDDTSPAQIESTPTPPNEEEILPSIDTSANEEVLPEPSHVSEKIPASMDQKEALKISQSLQWDPIDIKIPESAATEIFNAKKISHPGLLRQIKQRWFSLDVNARSGNIELHIIREWSSLYFLDNGNLEVLNQPDIYVFDSRIKLATLDNKDWKMRIKLVFPRGETRYIQMNGEVQTIPKK